MSPVVCPNCGADVPPNAKACPECGSDETTGWSNQTHVDGIDLPDDEFDYDDFVKREFGGKKPIPRGVHWVWWVAGLLLLVALAAMFFSQFHR